MNAFHRLGLGKLASLLLTRKPAALLLSVTTLALSVTVIASPLEKPGVSTPPASNAPKTHRWYQTGIASWYGKEFQGRRTATGERFNMNSLTCAHRTLPFGSWLRITNLRNSQSTFVRVNDRGPYQPHAVIDLSFRAAQKIGLLSVGQVRVEQVRADDPELAHALIAELVHPEQAAALN